MRLTWPALVVVLSACGDDAAAPDAPVSPPDPAAVAHFEPPAPGEGDWGDVPWPSDLFLDDSDRIAIGDLPAGPSAVADNLTMLREGLATLSGAGLRSNVYFPIDLAAGADLDPATLAGAGALIDLESGQAIDTEILWRADLGAVVLVPVRGTVLEPDHAYGAYLTSAIRTTGGEPLAPDEAFAGHASLASVLAAVPAAERDAVVAATGFRTAGFVAETRRMRDTIAGLTPTVTVLEVVAGDAELDAILGDQTDDAVPGGCNDNIRAQPHNRIAALVQGTITLTSFLSDTVAVDGFPEFDLDGFPVPKGAFPVRFTLALPATTADWNDLPVIVYVHGINRTRADFATQVNTAGRIGAAMLAIDLPYHGHRAARPAADLDQGNELLGTTEPDGFGDTYGLFPATDLFHLTPSGGIPGYHPRAMGENLRAAALEIAQLVEFVRDGDDAPIEAAIAPIAGLPDTLAFRDDVGLVTESLGAMVAGVTLAVEPDLGVAYLSSPAAGFPEPSMLHSPNFAGTFAPVITGSFDIASRIDETDPARDYRVDPIVMLYGNIIERGDAIAYAPQVTGGGFRGGAGPDLVVGMAWGDVWVSNDTSEAYGRALGLPYAPLALPAPPAEPLRFVELPEVGWPVSGNLPGGRSGGFVVYAPATHAALRKYADSRNYQTLFPPYVAQSPPEPVFPTQLAQHHELWSELHAGHFAGGAVTITDPYADLDPETGGSACP